MLWELFNESPSTLELYVRLCASSDYLATILKSNPGMVDELLDALQLKSLPDDQWFKDSLDALMRGAVDPGLILGSFKTTQHLRIGVRDIEGQDRIVETHRALAGVAEACLEQVANWQFGLMAKKYGLQESNSLNESPFVIVGMGKLGGREPNYHSDLDVIFLFHSCEHFDSILPPGITSQSFFNDLSTAIANTFSSLDSGFKLYELDSRLRPTGGSGTLAVHVDEFLRYFREGDGQLWERQALCKARIVVGNEPWKSKTEEAISEVLGLPLPEGHANEIWKMRQAMESSCRESNLKRGSGGTVDIEFAVQMLQLRSFPRVRQTGTLAAIEQLKTVNLLDEDTAGFLIDSYELLRSVESGLRLMNTTARHDLPNDEEQLRKLAYLLNYVDGDSLRMAVESCRKAVRKCVLNIFDIPEPEFFDS